jgi:hypothetical protein
MSACDLQPLLALLRTPASACPLQLPAAKCAVHDCAQSIHVFCTCSTEVDPNYVKNEKGDYEIVISTTACDTQGEQAVGKHMGRHVGWRSLRLVASCHHVCS